MSVKARTGLVQKALIDKGYNVEISYKLDKQTKKAIKDFQKSHNITPNCVICSKTYDLLNILEG